MTLQTHQSEAHLCYRNDFQLLYKRITVECHDIIYK